MSTTRVHLGLVGSSSTLQHIFFCISHHYCDTIHVFSSPSKSVFEGRSARLATGLVLPGFLCSTWVQVAPHNLSSWGGDMGSMCYCPVSCFFSLLKGLALRRQNSPVSSGQATQDAATQTSDYKGLFLTLLPFFRRPSCYSAS